MKRELSEPGFVIQSSSDLVTTHEERRSGFVSLALERSRNSTPIVQEARALYQVALSIDNPIGLLELTKIRPSLLTASGLSDKAVKHLLESDKVESIRQLIENYLKPAGEKFAEELVYRFLITRGDSLGGSMRNLGGAVAQAKLTRSIIAWLSLQKADVKICSRSKVRIWTICDPLKPNIEDGASGLAWKANREWRTLLFNVKVHSVGNNVDLVLLRIDPNSIAPESIKDHDLFLALGELKGGIDPAGADEHWKTAKSAFDRIRGAFNDSSHKPALFFVGAAIEARMAQEICAMIDNKTLTSVANLNKEDQIAGMCRWLTSL